MTATLRTRPVRSDRPVGRRGSVLLEAALILPVLLMLSLGCIEFGYFIHVKHTLNAAAHFGAREASLDTATADSVAAKVQAMMAALGDGDGGALTADDYTVTITDVTTDTVYTDPADVPAQNDVRVEVRVEWSTVGFYLTGVMSDGRDVVASVVMRKEG